MERKFDLVVLDVAGTTVLDNDIVAKCLQAALADFGHQKTIEQINPWMGITKPYAISQLAPELSADQVEACHENFRQKMIEFYRESEEFGPIPGAEAFFAECRSAGVKIALDTGFDRTIMDTILNRLSWHDKVDATATSDEAKGRPHPDLIQLLMERVGVDDPTRVAKVGDTPNDIAQGRAAACGLVIGVLHGTHTEEQLRPLEPDALAHGMPALRDLILA